MGKSGGSVSEGVEGEIKSGKGRTVDGKVWKGSGRLWQCLGESRGKILALEIWNWKGN